MSKGDEMHTPALASLKNIWKVFDGVSVLRDVNIDLKPGEIHALIGGNGSGKSTLMKILSGVYSAEAGTVEILGSPVHINNPARAHHSGNIPRSTRAQNIPASYRRRKHPDWHRPASGGGYGVHQTGVRRFGF